MANRYWVGGTGNWSDTAHWSATSGGASGASAPIETDDVFFDGSSGTGTSTLDVYHNIRSLDCTGYTGTLTLADQLDIGDSNTGTGISTLKLVSGMTFNPGVSFIDFYSDQAGNAITTGGKSLPKVRFRDFNGGGGWVLQDNITCTSIRVQGGDLDTNSKDVTITNGDFDIDVGFADSDVVFGSSTISVSGSFRLQPSFTLTVDAGTSSISAGDICYLEGTGYTLYNLSISGTFAGLEFDASGTYTFNNLTLDGTTNTTTELLFNNNAHSITITGTLTITGTAASPVNVYGLASPGLTNRSTIQAANISLSYVNFHGVAGTGAASPFTGTSLGNMGDCTGITFTTPVTRYWVGNAGNWNDTAHWSTSSGGASGASIPLPQDTATFDANSITIVGQSITIATTGLPNLEFSSVANSPTLNMSGRTIIRGNVNLTGLGTANLVNPYFVGGNTTINQASFNFSLIRINKDSGSSLTLAANTTVTPQVYKGTFATSTFNLSANQVLVRNTGTIDLGSGTHSLTGTFTLWSVDSTASVIRGTSTLQITDTSANPKWFAGGGKTYYALTIAGSATTNTEISGANTFYNLTITAPNTVKFESGVSQTIENNFTATGSIGNVIVVGSITGASQHTLLKGGGVVACDYLTVTDSSAGGGAAWYAGSHSTNGGNNTGWIFTDPPVGGGYNAGRNLALLGVG